MAGRTGGSIASRVIAYERYQYALTRVLEKLVAFLVVDGAHEAPQHARDESVTWPEDAPIHQYQLATAKEYAGQGRGERFGRAYPTTGKSQD